MRDVKNTKLWFTSDTHFGSQRTLELSQRPFDTVEDMDSKMIENWNRVVDKNDTVIHIGDFGDYSVADKLNGNIRLICGNYELDERRSDKVDFYKQISATKIKIISEGLPFLLKLGDEIVGMTHKPTEARYFFERKKWSFMLFGHIHKLQMVKEFGLNVGTDCHNFTPIDLDTVKFYKNAVQNHYDEDVFIR